MHSSLYRVFWPSDQVSSTQSSELDKKRTVRICRVLPMLYLSQHICFGVHVAFSTNKNPGKPVQTRSNLCYFFTQSVDEDKESKKMWTSSPTRCVKSL